MDHYYLVVLVFLLLLAVFDLFVGVSNDAVNFMNSAVGSRVAPFRVVLCIASLGVLIGSTFSSGMMEIARSGVFNPQMLTFQEIMIVFLAVMIADVLLLDVFNSLGLPTSTTVSIVFELLGGTVAIAIIKLYNQPFTGHEVADFINNKKAMAIVSGILTSVVVAFISGIIVQYITRLIFTFKYEKIYRHFAGALFGGVSITAILYFLVMKGAKGASFMHPEYVTWINTHTMVILLSIFVATTIFFQFLIWAFKTNIFRFIILAGTFALAFSFAGNDLVNFVGVPLAALDSFIVFNSNSLSADVMTMEMLLGPVQMPTFYLLLSGLIMVITLFISKKAKRVIQTEVNLSSSSRGAKEKFGSSVVSRAIVRSSFNFGKVLHQLFPAGFVRFVDKRMVKIKPQKGEIPLPFDHLRASINLVVSSILIASATSLKLPLSTTYVTFMVAMGSSLADGAWDRESAVYRINGVLSVIGGWFLTALCAFTLAGVIVVALFYGQGVAAVILIVLVLFTLIKTNFFSKHKDDTFPPESHKSDKVSICKSVNDSVLTYFDSILMTYRAVTTEFLEEKLKELRKTKNKAVLLHEEIVSKRGEYYRFAYEGGEDKIDLDAKYYYYRVFTNLKEIGYGLRGVAGIAYNHINNNHSVYRGTLQDNLLTITADLEDLRDYLNDYAHAMRHEDELVAERTRKSIKLIDSTQHQMLTRIEKHNLSLRSSELYLSFLQFSRDIVNRFSLIALLQHELNDRCRA